MTTVKAVKPPISNDRTSEAQISLQYAQQVAAKVYARTALNRRLRELNALQVTHPVDVELRDDLVRTTLLRLKGLDSDE